jgi:hypothetical protein
MRNLSLFFIYFSCLTIISISGKAQQGVSLIFNHNGKLINTLPETITGIKDFVIQMPVKTLKKIKGELDEKREAVGKQINNSNSFFYQLLHNGKTEDSARIRHLYTDNSTKYSFQSRDNFLNTNTDSAGLRLFPDKFINYYNLLTLLLQLGDNIGTVPANNDLIPYAVSVGKNKRSLKCICIKRSSENLEFYFNNTEPANADGSFTYNITYTDNLQQLTLNHLNNAYKNTDSTIRMLNLIDGYLSKEVKQFSEKINSTVDSIAMLEEFPKGTSLRQAREDTLWSKYGSLRKELIKKIGDINENNTIFQTSAILQQWIFQWAWLTGGTGILNPFKFTSGNKISTNNIDADILKVKDAFYTRMIDSLKSVADTSKLEYLLNNKQLLKSNSGVIARDKNSAANNDKEIDKLAYTGWTLHSGTIFLGNKHNITRNYYFDNDVKANKNKFKFKYPEDDSVYLLYHNVPTGTVMEIQGSYKSFDDTPDFTKFVSKAIDTLGGLFSLVNGAAGGISKIIKNLSLEGTKKFADVQKTDLSNGVVGLTEKITKPGFEVKESNYNGYISVLQSANLQAIDTLNVQGSIRQDNFIKLLQRSNKITIDSIKQKMAARKLLSINANELKIAFDNIQANLEKQQIKTKFLNGFAGDAALQSSLLIKIGSLPPNLLPVDYQDSVFNMYNRINLVRIPNGITINERNFYKFLSQTVSSKVPPIPSEDFVVSEKTDTTPKYKTQAFVPDAKEAPYKFEYSFTKVIKSDTAKSGFVKFKTDSSYFNIGKRYRFQLAAGLAYSFAPILRTDIDTSKNTFSINKDGNRVRIIAGVRFYLGKGIYQHDNRFIPKGKLDWLDKTSIMVGVGIPKPLDNYYIGAGYDIVPGFNINFGSHIYRYTNYKVANNTIVDNSSALKVNGYVALTLDPTLFVKILKTL